MSVTGTKSAYSTGVRPIPGATQIAGRSTVNAYFIVFSSPSYPGISGLGIATTEPATWILNFAPSGAQFFVDLYVKVEAFSKEAAEGISMYLPSDSAIRIAELESLTKSIFLYSSPQKMTTMLISAISAVDCGRILSIGGRKSELLNQDDIRACNRYRTDQMATYAKWDLDVSTRKRELRQLICTMGTKMQAYVEAASPKDSMAKSIGATALTAASILTAPIGGFLGFVLLDKIYPPTAELEKQILQTIRLRITRHELDQLQRIESLLEELKKLGISKFDELQIDDCPNFRYVVARGTGSNYGNCELSDYTSRLIHKKI
jgi:hypothetical protein